MCAALWQFHFHSILWAENSHGEIAQPLWRGNSLLDDLPGFLLHRNTVLRRTRTKPRKRFAVNFSNA